MSSQVKDEILKLVDGLPDSQLEKLLDLMKQMKDKSSSGRKGRFDKFFGVISHEDAAIMRQAIAERETIDPNAW